MLRVAVFALCVALAVAYPTRVDPRSRADKDLMLNDMRGPDGQIIRSGIIGGTYRWPNGVVPYELDSAFSADERNTILAGLQDISSKTCITFVERSNQANYVFIDRGQVNSGCWSYVGRVGGRQVLNLQPPEYQGAPHCIWVGTAAHEMIHAIGYYHQQSRYDRDDWVTINWSNIPSSVAYNFDAMSPSEIDTFGVPYDYASIMHYDAYAFAIDTNVPTIIPKTPGATLGGDVVTERDAAGIRAMYQC